MLTSSSCSLYSRLSSFSDSEKSAEVFTFFAKENITIFRLTCLDIFADSANYAASASSRNDLSYASRRLQDSVEEGREPQEVVGDCKYRLIFTNDYVTTDDSESCLASTLAIPAPLRCR